MLKQPPDLPANALRSFCERLGVRAEMSPSTFTVADADLLCRQLDHLYADNAGGPAALRHVIKPAYRSMFELLSGQARALETPVLFATPLLAETAEGHQFLPGSEVLFAGTPGIKERSGLAGRVPIFVLEAEPAAEAPLTSIFGCRVLEKVLDWQPDPGECTQTSTPHMARTRGIRSSSGRSTDAGSSTSSAQERCGWCVSARPAASADQYSPPPRRRLRAPSLAKATGSPPTGRAQRSPTSKPAPCEHSQNGPFPVASSQTNLACLTRPRETSSDASATMALVHPEGHGRGATWMLGPG